MKNITHRFYVLTLVQFQEQFSDKGSYILLGSLFRMSSVYFSLFSRLLSSFGSFVLRIIHLRVVGVVAQSPDYRLLLIWSEKSSAVAFCVRANVVLSSATAGFIGF